MVSALLAANWLVALAAITLVIATLYHVCPDVDFPWRWFSPGSVLFTIGFAVTTSAFSYWVSHFGTYDKTYGSLGAVIILLLWMYLIAFLMLLGGEVNAYLDRAALELLPAEPEPVDDTDADRDPDVPAWARRGHPARLSGISCDARGRWPRRTAGVAPGYGADSDRDGSP